MDWLHRTELGQIWMLWWRVGGSTFDFFRRHRSQALQTRFRTLPSTGEEASMGGVACWAIIWKSVCAVCSMLWKDSRDGT
jgi:hypothetical protein